MVTEQSHYLLISAAMRIGQKANLVFNSQVFFVFFSLLPASPLNSFLSSAARQ